MRRVETIFVVVAIGFYVWFLSHFGPGKILGYVRLAGWGLALTISLEAFARIANTLGWRVTIENYPPRLPFRRLFAARIAGEAVDYTTPSAQLGGQFVMALMVRRDLRMAVGLATAIVAALAESIGQIVFVAAALAFSLRLIPAAADLYRPIAGGFALAVALAAGFFFVQMKHPFSHLRSVAEKFDFTRDDAERMRESAGEADALLLDIYSRHRRRVLLSCLYYTAAWSLGPVEIYILLKLLHQPASITVALLVEALGLLIERAMFLIPAKLVSQEGGKALILSLVGYPAGIGFAIGFLRRIKEMVWVLAGLACLAIHRMAAERAGGAVSPGEMMEMQRVQGEQSL
ncbi:MAG: lysylphosphatidylglycerol synthase domain-containing protein [Candidatus Binataceae bacterium]